MTGSNVVVAIVVVAIVVVFGSVFLTMITSIIGAFVSVAAGDGGGAVLFSFVPFVVMGVVIALVLVGLLRGTRSHDERMYRLDRFARANAMQYEPRLDAPGLPGMIFSIGSSRRSSDLVRGDRPRFVEFANYRYTTGSGKNRQTHQWGYVAVKLDTPLPHIVLDATSNNGLFGSNLPLTFDKDQRLSLEGDFDEYFSLYCPADYERDALYLFTPDIMARFIDNAAALDVEIVDDWLFLYAKRDFSTLDPATWAWLFSVVGALLDKFAQWARWRDERLAAAAAASMTDAAPLGSAAVPVGAGQGAQHPCLSIRRSTRCARLPASRRRAGACSAACRGRRSSSAASWCCSGSSPRSGPRSCAEPGPARTRERMLSGVHSTFTTPGGREGVLGAHRAERR